MQILERLRGKKQVVIDKNETIADARNVLQIVRMCVWFAMDVPKDYLLKRFVGGRERLERACDLLHGKAGFLNYADHLHYERAYAFGCARCVYNKPSGNGAPSCLKKGTSLAWLDARFVCAEACPSGLEEILQ